MILFCTLLVYIIMFVNKPVIEVWANHNLIGWASEVLVSHSFKKGSLKIKITSIFLSLKCDNFLSIFNDKCYNFSPTSRLSFTVLQMYNMLNNKMYNKNCEKPFLKIVQLSVYI